MTMGDILLLALTLFASSVFAAEYDGTRIANRTIERTVQLRTHSLFAPYIDQDLQNRWWDFGADAYVNSNKYVRLTRNKQSQMGWLWSRFPLTATNFIVEVEFKISGSTSHLFGDGLALWLTSEHAQPGPVFGSKDHFTGIGIFLDTYKNDLSSDYPFPRIIAMQGDGKTSYDVGKDGVPNMIGECAADYRHTGVATKLKVIYVKDTVLDVKLHWKGWEEWTDCFTLKDITLPPNPYLGLSAMTGDISDAHEHHAISSGPRSLIPGWFSFFMRLLIFGAVLAGVWYGWKMYGQRYGNSGAFGGGRGGLMWSDGKRF
ncbi:legume-like lectin family-domain-containing protein [Russula earlei]|uniref:Legume-like lectin family-domain-containing protein n=1 Tax=Russula earlei TaxID=71964 RepID=A0ACC0UIT2_9AGAM|nr:legume-like lectin family-domain-containing protein [Russula earlei]